MRLTSAGKVWLADDDMGRAMGARQFGLLLGGDHADHGGAEMLCPLAHDQPDTAGRGVDDDGVARLHAIGAAEQVLRGQALQHHRGGGVEFDTVGQLDQAVGRDHPLGGIGADRAGGIGDAIADGNLGDAGADRQHAPGTLHPDAGRRTRVPCRGRSGNTRRCSSARPPRDG